MSKRPVDSITAQVAAMVPVRFTVAQAARAVGRSTDTLKRWRVSGAVVPSDTVTFGQVTVNLYTLEDIQRLKIHAKAQRPGRKKSDATT